MAYDEHLAERLRGCFRKVFDMDEKHMFGGLAMMVKGHMCCGVVKDALMVRVGKDRYEAALQRSHVREMDFTGKPLTGFVYVEAKGIIEDEDLAWWVTRDWITSLPCRPRPSKLRPARQEEEQRTRR